METSYSLKHLRPASCGASLLRLNSSLNRLGRVYVRSIKAAPANDLEPSFTCQNCGQDTLRKTPIPCEKEEHHGDPGPLANLYTCATCAENYLAVVHYEKCGARVETWRYYLDRRPSLIQVARYRPSGFVNEDVLTAREYAAGCELVSREEWHRVLDRVRRRVATETRWRSKVHRDARRNRSGA